MLGMLSENHFPEDMTAALKGFQLGMQIIILHSNVPPNYIRNSLLIKIYSKLSSQDSRDQNILSNIWSLFEQQSTKLQK